MRVIVSLLVLATSGCAYTEAQMRLAEQVQEGVKLVQQSQQQRKQLVEEYHRLQRQCLDDAFDADVRQRADLSAQWIIEARTAYAAALDALYRQRQASEAADAATARNLDALDQTAQRLLFLQSLQLKLLNP
jgi:hypothetical protein